MRVFGVDPGSHVTGWGVLRRVGSQMQRVGHGTIRAEGETLAARLQCIADELDSLFSIYKPDVVAVEGIFHQKNSRSALVLGHARGVILLSVSRAALPLVEYSPAEIKRATTGHGRADKERVRSMIGSILGFNSNDIPYDASDALATAVCHAALAKLTPRVSMDKKQNRVLSPLAEQLKRAARG